MFSYSQIFTVRQISNNDEMIASLVRADYISGTRTYTSPSIIYCQYFHPS